MVRFFVAFSGAFLTKKTWIVAEFHGLWFFGFMIFVNGGITRSSP